MFEEHDTLIDHVAVDTGGNVVVVGVFFGLIDLGGRVLRSTGDSSIFLASYNPDSVLRWSRQFDDGGPTDLAVDSRGDIYVVGNFNNEVELGGGTIATIGRDSAYLASYSHDGQYRWSVVFDRAQLLGVAVREDAVSVVGTFWASVRAQDTSLSATSVGPHALISKVSVSGEVLWMRTVDHAEYAELESVGLDGAGGLVALGNAAAVRDSRFNTIASTQHAAIVVRLSPTGELSWGRQFAFEWSFEARALALDSMGNVYVQRLVNGSVPIGDRVVGVAQRTTLVMLSYDAEGALRWARTFGDGDVNFSPGGVVALGDHVYFSGDVMTLGANGRDPGVDLGTGALHSQGHDLYVVGLSGDGSLCGAALYGGAAEDMATAATSGPDHSLYVVGSLFGTSVFGATQRESGYPRIYSGLLVRLSGVD